jgi:chromosomal replication initiation ATPase DnaA
MEAASRANATSVQALHAAVILRLAEIAAVRAFRIQWATLHRASRGKRRESGARQTAFYLARCAGQLNVLELSRLSGRDRTTVRHAFACVERARATRGFDLQLVLLEQAVSRSARSVVFSSTF